MSLMNGHRNTEQSIMDAAEKLFLEKGYTLSTTTLIAKEAGVTHAMLHYYFRTKEQIFIKVLNKNIGELISSLRPIMMIRRPVWETLKEGIEMMFDFLNTHRQLAGLIYDVINYNPRLLESYITGIGGLRNRLFEQHRDMLEKEISSGRMNHISIEQIIYDIVSMNMSVFMSINAMKNILNLSAEECDEFIRRQKAEITDKIHYRLYGKLC